VDTVGAASYPRPEDMPPPSRNPLKVPKKCMYNPATQTMTLRGSPTYNRVVGFVLIPVGIFLAVGSFVLPGGSDAGISSRVVVAILGIVCLWLGVHALRLRVDVRPDGIVAHNWFTRREADVKRIRAIGLRWMSRVNVENNSLLPSVELTDGSWFLISAIECQTKRTTLERRAQVNAMRHFLGVGGSNIEESYSSLRRGLPRSKRERAEPDDGDQWWLVPRAEREKRHRRSSTGRPRRRRRWLRGRRAGAPRWP
jgi:hypothetical protein